MYNSSSFVYIIIEKVSLNTWIIMLSSTYKQIILTACIWNLFQIFSPWWSAFSYIWKRQPTSTGWAYLSPSFVREKNALFIEPVDVNFDYTYLLHFLQFQSTWIIRTTWDFNTSCYGTTCINITCWKIFRAKYRYSCLRSQYHCRCHKRRNKRKYNE